MGAASAHADRHITDPFSGNFLAGAAHTIHARHRRDMHVTARKGFARHDHERFTDFVISGDAS
jgi:hypothetical protein